MQCARAIPFTWLGSGSCQARPSRLNTNEWYIYIYVCVCVFIYVLFICLFLDFVRRSRFIFDSQYLGNGFCFRLQVERVWRELGCVLPQDARYSANAAVPQYTSAIRCILGNSSVGGVPCILRQSTAEFSLLYFTLHLLSTTQFCPMIYKHWNTQLCYKILLLFLLRRYSVLQCSADRHFLKGLLPVSFVFFLTYLSRF